MNLLERKQTLKSWKEKISSLKSLSEKSKCLDSHESVREKLFSNSSRFMFYQKCNEEEKYVLKSVFVIGEDKTLFSNKDFEKSKIKPLLKSLIEIENFCEEIGGIIGYQYCFLHLMTDLPEHKNQNVNYLPAQYIDITENSSDVRKKVRIGIERLPQMAELYALGGAADRLHLQDPISGDQLPAAMMNFNQRSLLEILVEDLKAREYLYEKLFAKKIIIPVGIMTSYEKNNHEIILDLCEKNHWFGRPKESFFFFTQPSVPVIDQKGRWVVNKPYSLLLKPGGHGAIWKLAKNKRVFQWMRAKGKTKVIVRQINNPIAGVDYGLLAFYGYGISKDYLFGFASCARRVHSAEGVNVLIEKKVKDYYEYVLSNIEYCEFKKYGIEDKPFRKGGKYSKFSSNTNLLFADLNALEEKVSACPFPGMLVNFKQMIIPTSKKKIFAGRLETTMQNIADSFVEKTKKRLSKFSAQKTFVTYNHRNKTISTTKKVYIPGKNYFETPEKCFYDCLKNHYELLKDYCQFKLPKFFDFETYLKKGVPFLFSYSPSLGPMYSIISQKIHTGILHEKSEMAIHLSEILIRNLELNGSLFIQGEDSSSWCILKNVKIENDGIDDTGTHLWKGEFFRKGFLKIILSKQSGFYAENIVFSKNQTIKVEMGQILTMSNGKKSSTAFNENEHFRWKYYFGKENEIKLKAVRYCLQT